METGHFITVQNKSRKFGSLSHYIIGEAVVNAVGCRLAFTQTEIRKAMARAEKNPEDFIRKVPR